MWLREHGCPADLRDCRAFADDGGGPHSINGSVGGHIEVVEWLDQFSDVTWHTTGFAGYHVTDVTWHLRHSTAN